MHARGAIILDLPSGISLHGLSWNGNGEKPSVICLHGLTRNALDFEDLGPLVAKEGHDVFAISFRGRGKSTRDPNWQNYHPEQYRDDILKCLNILKLESAIFVGTSLGGIVTMLIAALDKSRVKAAIINDVGPRLAEEGLLRIGGYVGAKREPVSHFSSCIEHIKSINKVAFPDADEAFWTKMAKRTFAKNQGGKWELNYDPNISKALAEAGHAPELEPGWQALNDTPTLLIRGALSDLLSKEIVDEMRRSRPGFSYAEVDRVGHAPTLSEPKAIDAIVSFLKNID